MTTTDSRPPWARRIVAERERRGWSQRRAVKVMQAHGNIQSFDSLLRQWKYWEAGTRLPDDHNQRLIARTFGTVAGALFAATPTLEVADAGTLEVLARIRGTDITPDSLEAIEAAVDRLGVDYSRAPSDVLHADGHRWLTRLTGLLEGRLTLAQHRDILSLAGRVALLVGCVEYDLGQRDAAESTRLAAQSLGEESGDANVVGWACEMGAWYHLTQGRYLETIRAADAGLAAVDSSHSVGVQLAAHKAKAWARLGDRRETEVAVDQGRRLLEALPECGNLENHFVVDPSKWDFYTMDAYRHVGEDDLAAMYADEVIRTGTADDGTVVRPMRVAEAHITRGVVAARAGDRDAAVGEGRTALGLSRKSLPSLLLHSRELESTLRGRFGQDPVVGAYADELRALAA